MSQTVLEPEVIDSGSTQGRWAVAIFNNDINSIDEVIQILMLATGCSLDEAKIETWEAHTFGKTRVHFDSKPKCELVASIISTIGVQTEVAREWEEA